MSTYFSKFGNVSEMPHARTFFLIFLKVLSSDAFEAQSAIAALVRESFHEPFCSKSKLNLPMRSVSPATSASLCIKTLTARSIPFSSPNSKMFMSSNFLLDSFIAIVEMISRSAWSFAFFTEYPCETRFFTRSNSRCVSKLTLTFSR